MEKDFNIQIPTNLVRNKEVSMGEFALCAKLIQVYYSQYGDDKSLTFTVDHRAIMYYLSINDNDTFKKYLKGLYKNEIILNKIDKLSRKGDLEITLNENIIPELNKEGHFTQLPYYVLNREILKAAGFIGLRLLYYYKSYINAKDYDRQFCFVAIETTSQDLDITEKTIIKHNKLLQKLKFIKIEKHELHNTYDYIPIANGKEKYFYTRYNNHYILRLEKIEEFCEKKRSLLVENV